MRACLPQRPEWEAKSDGFHATPYSSWYTSHDSRAAAVSRSPSSVRHAAHRVEPHLVRHGNVGAARIGRDQGAARLPEVAFGVEMQHFRAYAGLAGALQDAAAAAADRVAQIG